MDINEITAKALIIYLVILYLRIVTKNNEDGMCLIDYIIYAPIALVALLVFGCALIDTVCVFLH